MIKIAMNGGRSKAEHPAVPTTVEEYAQEIAWFMARRINTFHIHFRDAEGRESLDQRVIEPQFRLLKKLFPECRIGVGSPLQNGITAAMRHSRISQWSWRPDFISLNLSEEGSLGLASALRGKRIPIEYGLFSIRDARIFANKQLNQHACRALVELVLTSSPARALRDARAIESFLSGAYPKLELLFHAEGLPTWPVIAWARSLGKNWRIGLEDTLTLPDGGRAANNRELYLAALETAL